MQRLIILFFLFFVTNASAELNFKGNNSALVIDSTNTLKPEEISSLERKLVAFDDSTSTQIAIVIVANLHGYPIDEYGQKLAEFWGIGGKKNNGALVLVAMEERQMDIEVGRGLEPVITDGLAKRIIEQQMKPNFKQGAYYAGLNIATTSIMELAVGEFKGFKNNKEKEHAFPRSAIFIVIGIIFIVLFSKFRSVRSYSQMNHIPFWAAWTLMSAASNRHSGRWSDFSSGGGIFGGGGGSGGGFGGFGGGSFGGGGASGSW